MRDNSKRLDKIEKRLGISEKSHRVVIAGMKMSSDELKEILICLNPNGAISPPSQIIN